MTTGTEESVFSYLEELLSEDGSAEPTLAEPNRYRLFEVGTVRFAVPVQAVESVITSGEIGDGHGDDGQAPLTVIETAAHVLPDGFGPKRSATKSLLLVLTHRPFALRCDKVGHEEKIEAGAIVYRSERSSRSWLLGTVKSHRCAIIDVDELIVLAGGS